MQAPDGIRIDDKGRVWTAEGEGVVVHAADPKILGVFNAHFFTGDRVKTAIVQFELVEDKAVILGQDKLWIVKVGCSGLEWVSEDLTVLSSPLLGGGRAMDSRQYVFLFEKLYQVGPGNIRVSLKLIARDRNIVVTSIGEELFDVLSVKVGQPNGAAFASLHESLGGLPCRDEALLAAVGRGDDTGTMLYIRNIVSSVVTGGFLVVERCSHEVSCSKSPLGFNAAGKCARKRATWSRPINLRVWSR
ncbi:hypothetical protein LTR93_011908 [Exophiala xenobiotica]|nr:hypothetical protein LTR93_011908 [Exophiala xenobiotica]